MKTNSCFCATVIIFVAGTNSLNSSSDNFRPFKGTDNILDYLMKKIGMVVAVVVALTASDAQAGVQVTKPGFESTEKPVRSPPANDDPTLCYNDGVGRHKNPKFKVCLYKCGQGRRVEDTYIVSMRCTYRRYFN